MRKYEKVLFDKCIKNVCEMESHIKAEGGKSGFMGLICRSQKLKKKILSKKQNLFLFDSVFLKAGKATFISSCGKNGGKNIFLYSLIQEKCKTIETTELNNIKES